MSFLLQGRRRLKALLTPEERRKAKRFHSLRFRGVQRILYGLICGSNLRSLALLYDTDKWGHHRYAQHYERHLAHLRWNRINILEIGIGGYDDPSLGGGSLRMWRTYFPRARVFGIDIYDKTLHDERRIRTFKGSQADGRFLETVVKTIGRIDVVIDDGSHMNEHVLYALRFLFPRMSQEGLYVIEDTQTSFQREFGGSSEVIRNGNTTMGFLKELADGLNYDNFQLPDYEPTYFDKHVTAVHFYKNIVFIQKGVTGS